MSLKKKIVIILLLMIPLGCASMGYDAKGERLSRMQASKNFKDGIFVNEIDTPKLTASQFKVSMKFFFGGSDRREPENPIPIVKMNKDSFSQKPEKGLRLTWMGHSTLLLEMGEQIILIDPVFSKRTSPVGWMGPKRFHEVPISIQELPQIDIVLISHDHYDHLDIDSILKLKDKTNSFVMPLGIGAHLEGWGIDASKIYELDWWDTINFDKIEFICTPARHFSGRGLNDENKTLWASWVIRSEGNKRRNLFYSGDTGPMPAFKTIGDKYGPFDLTMIQLGAYGNFWPYMHMTPEEAIEAHKQLKGKLMLPVHWGTFNLALHGWDEPIIRTRKEAKKQKIEFIEPRPGEMIEL